MEDKELPALYMQYHGCWWPGDTRSQGISSHDIDLILLEYIDFSTRRGNSIISKLVNINISGVYQT